MASVYLDTSALVKLYIEEDGTQQVVDLTENPDRNRIIILDVTQIELRSAIRRREREGDIAIADSERILRQAEEDTSSSFLVQPSTAAMIEEAARLIDGYPLRTYDALQLAGCLVVGQTLPEPLIFVCADSRLCEAGRLEGLAVSNPVSPDSPSS